MSSDDSLAKVEFDENNCLTRRRPKWHHDASILAKMIMTIGAVVAAGVFIYVMFIPEPVAHVGAKVVGAVAVYGMMGTSSELVVQLDNDSLYNVTIGLCHTDNHLNGMCPVGTSVNMTRMCWSGGCYWQIDSIGET